MKQCRFGFFVLLVFLMACEKKESSSSSTFKEGSFEKGEKIIEAKKDQGDTLAMAYENLIKFLPANVAGYIPKDNGTGKTDHSNGSSWSMAEKIYVNGNKKIKITLADYNGAYGLYAGATAIFSLDKTENKEERSLAITLKNGKWKAWESYKKVSREAFLITGINDRFLLTLEAEDQIDTELIKSVAENLDLDKLIN